MRYLVPGHVGPGLRQMSIVVRTPPSSASLRNSGRYSDQETVITVVPQVLGSWWKMFENGDRGFYTEFRYRSREHSGLAWGAILRKIVVLTLIARLPCSFSRNKLPKWILFQMLQSERSLWIRTYTNTYAAAGPASHTRPM